MNMSLQTFTSHKIEGEKNLWGPDTIQIFLIFSVHNCQNTTIKPCSEEPFTRTNCQKLVSFSNKDKTKMQDLYYFYKLKFQKKI